MGYQTACSCAGHASLASSRLLSAWHEPTASLPRCSKQASPQPALPTSTAVACRHGCLQADGVVTRLLGGRHWVALRCLGGRWWNLDSSLPAPQLVSACCSGGELAVPAGSSGPAVPVPPDVASTAGRKADLAAAEAAEEAADSVAASAAAAEAEADGSGKVATSRGAPASSSPCRAPPTAGAAEGAATPSDVAAADAAAVRMFLMQQVHEKDAKIFCVLDLPLASHPLPDDCSRSSADVPSVPITD